MLRSFRPYGACLALALAACNSQPAKPPEQQAAAPEPAAPSVPVSGPPRLVLAFGDSLYAGYGLKRAESLPDALERMLRAQGIDAMVVNAGVSGDTTAGGRQRLAYTLDNLPRKPDLVVLGLGGNDALRQLDAAETRANMEAMLAEPSKRKVPVVLTGMMAPPNLGPDYSASFNRIWPDLAKQHHATLDPFILDGVIGNRALLLPDGIHPNAEGVTRIATRLAPVIGETLRQLPG